MRFKMWSSVKDDRLLAVIMRIVVCQCRLAKVIYIVYKFNCQVDTVVAAMEVIEGVAMEVTEVVAVEAMAAGEC